jgi:GNAT superfamily N-acetyltransferase
MSTTAGLHIVDTDPQGEAALALLREAAIDARALYPELNKPDAPWPTNPPLPERGVYVLAYAGETAVACGALRPLDQDTAEVRRMYVHRDHRRGGIAREVLVHLAQRAKALGYRRLVLETGYRQEPAMRLYESFGFIRIPAFGEYADDPTSVCFGMEIA